MKESRVPYFMFYPSDWTSDPAIKQLTSAEKGLLIELYCSAHQGEPYGYLAIHGQAIQPKYLAKELGVSVKRLADFVEKLISLQLILIEDHTGLHYLPYLVSQNEKREKWRQQKQGQRSKNPVKNNLPINVQDLSEPITSTCSVSDSHLFLKDLNGPPTEPDSELLMERRQPPPKWRPSPKVVCEITSRYPDMKFNRELERFREHYTANPLAKPATSWDGLFNAWIQKKQGWEQQNRLKGTRRNQPHSVGEIISTM